MTTELRGHIKRCLDRFRSGDLTEKDLQNVLDLLDAQEASKSRQSLLYLQASNSSPYGEVIGISIYEEGKDREGVDENGDFLYTTIQEALEDGWRIIKFPEMVLAMDDQNNYGLGYEFILERWR
ncbi:MAG: hypothetical protein O7G87_17485 [bacterium]|nr:hypothetical protein [bacterium]